MRVAGGKLTSVTGQVTTATKQLGSSEGGPIAQCLLGKLRQIDYSTLAPLGPLAFTLKLDSKMRRTYKLEVTIP
jgi:hypothetical protein